jgi:hypothetical protein
MSGVTRVGANGAVGAPDSPPTTAEPVAVETAPLLPDPEAQLLASGDPGAMVAALVVESAKDERDVSQQIEQAQTELEDQQEQAEVQAMHEKASSMRTQAWTSGLIGVAQGAMSLGAAGVSDSGAKDGMGKAARSLEAGAKMVGAARDVSTGLASAANEDTDATITAHEQAAAHAKRTAGETYDNERDAEKLLGTALDFYKEYESAQDQARAAAVHRG